LPITSIINPFAPPLGEETLPTCRNKNGGAGRSRTADTQFRKLSSPTTTTYFQQLTGAI
jgi:hypothetical protein